MSDQRLHVEELDPRYCPNWLTRVPHGAHEHRYEFVDADGVSWTGAYLCLGVHSARFPARDVDIKGDLL